MKKKFLKSTVIVLTMFFLTLTSVNAQPPESNDLKDILIKYFSHTFEVKKNLENVDNQYIVPDSLLKKEDNLNSKFLADYANQIGEKIINYNLDLDMNVISQDNESIKVDVVTKTNFNYLDCEDESYSEEHHIVYLKNYNGRMLVEKDVFDSDRDLNSLDTAISSDDAYTNYMNEKINNLEKKINGMDSILESEKNVTPEQPSRSKRSVRSSSGYNGSKGAQWAKTYAHPGRDKENKYSADCTNFASWTLFRGGMKTDKVWYHYSNAWIRVIELRNWLVNKGYATERDSYKYARLGDIIQYKSKAGVWRHSVVVTSKTSSYPYVRVSAHSKNRSDVNVSGLYYPNGEFVGYRVLCIR
ncbi:MAG: amidase domain-containing protein [Paraclostridium sp.]|uniref:amidase domain-containing protein n=1 Tax=Paraclostridium sp. TaxID=2023273 RepID=UPI003EE7FA41